MIRITYRLHLLTVPNSPQLLTAVAINDNYFCKRSMLVTDGQTVRYRNVSSALAYLPESTGVTLGFEGRAEVSPSVFCT